MSKAIKNNLKMNKYTDEELQEAVKSKYYRNELERFIDCESIKIESNDFEFDNKNNDHEGCVKIVIRNACIIESKPQLNIEPHSVIEHLWILVSDNFVLDEGTNKLIIKGVVHPYIHDGIKNLGVHARTIRCTKFKEIREPETPPITVPEEFANLVFNDEECEIISAAKHNESAEGPIDLSDWRLEYAYIKELGGYRQANAKINSIKNKLYGENQEYNLYNQVNEFLLKYPLLNFDINHADDAMKNIMLGARVPFDLCRKARFSYSHGYNDNDKKSCYGNEENYLHTNYKDLLECLKQCELTIESRIIDEIRSYTEDEIETLGTIKFDDETIKKAFSIIILHNRGYLNFTEKMTNEFYKKLKEYEKEMEEYEDKKAKYKKMLNDNGLNLDDVGEFNVHEPVKPKNDDKPYIEITLTGKAKNLLRWFGEL